MHRLLSQGLWVGGHGEGNSGHFYGSTLPCVRRKDELAGRLHITVICSPDFFALDLLFFPWFEKAQHSPAMLTVNLSTTFITAYLICMCFLLAPAGQPQHSFSLLLCCIVWQQQWEMRSWRLTQWECAIIQLWGLKAWFQRAIQHLGMQKKACGSITRKCVFWNGWRLCQDVVAATIAN